MVVEVEPRHPSLLEIYDLSGRCAANIRPTHRDDGQYTVNARPMYGQYTEMAVREEVVVEVKPRHATLRTQYTVKIRPIYGQYAANIRIHGGYTFNIRSIYSYYTDIRSRYVGSCSGGARRDGR